jgi:hypothetical protein
LSVFRGFAFSQIYLGRPSAAHESVTSSRLHESDVTTPSSIFFIDI